jgi:hypothetical protein
MEELGAWLARLNQQCRYELLVIGASCYGAAAQAAMAMYEHSAAFAACIGFRTSVYPEQLLEAMKDIYFAVQKGEDILAAVDVAKRALGDNAQIEFRTGLGVSYDILRYLREQYSDSKEIEARFRRTLAGKSVSPDFWNKLPAFIDERRRIRSEEAWNIWFPTELVQLQPSYRLDWSIVDA